MPLHDWTDCPGWEGVHHLWITELARWIKPRLPTGYRVYIRSTPLVAAGGKLRETDKGATEAEPEPSMALFVERNHRLVTSVEVVSPWDKDCDEERAASLARYVRYLREGVNLLLVDVHSRPLNFSFAEAIEAKLRLTQSQLPPPLAVSYSFGGLGAGGGPPHAFWRKPLAVGAPLPSMPLPLSVAQEVTVDLEATYAAAAADAYLP